MRLLVEHGVHVVAGVLHGSDTDVEVAERLDIEHVSVPAFSEIDEEAAAAWLCHAAAADVIVVCDPPVGPGNVRNLELALEAATSGTTVILLDSIPIAERDFTDGRATELWTQLRDGATLAPSYHDAVEAILARAPAR
jgi:iron complex transport system ATP-binding protein